MYKAIFIDWHGTLSNSKFWWQLEESNLKRDRLIFKRIQQSLFVNLLELLKPWMLGELRSEEVMAKVSEDAGLSYEKVFDQFVYSCKFMKLTSPDLLELIAKFRGKGTKVIIATDNMDSFARWTFPCMNLFEYFDGYLNSHNIKAMKDYKDEQGESMFFSEYLRREGIRKDESVLIDDSDDKEQIINSFGIKYIKVDPENNLQLALNKLLLTY